jgi:hypothetical protein
VPATGLDANGSTGDCPSPPFFRRPRFRSCPTLDPVNRVGVDALVQQPQAGRPVDELESEFCEWLIEFGEGRYAARYRADDDSVTIVTISHQREAGY